MSTGKGEQHLLGKQRSVTQCRVDLACDSLTDYSTFFT